MNNTQATCRCGSTLPFSQCCKPFLIGHSKPKAAEQLMRSRFTAFSLQNHQYLLNTLHTSQRQDDELAALKQNSQHTTWIQLSVLQTKAGQAGDNEGMVEFTASFEEDGEFYQLHECSNFIFENEQWYYTTGNNQVCPITLTIGRNDACWCHSRKKFKKCHG